MLECCFRPFLLGYRSQRALLGCCPCLTLLKRSPRPTLLGYCSQPNLLGYCSRPVGTLSPTNQDGTLSPTDNAGILFPAGIPILVDPAGILFPADFAELITVGVADVAVAGVAPLAVPDVFTEPELVAMMVADGVETVDGSPVDFGGACDDSDYIRISGMDLRTRPLL